MRQTAPFAAAAIPPAPIRPAIDELQTSGIQQVFDRGIGKPGIVGLWVGEGDLPTPGFICEATERSLRAGETFYTHKRGLPELRQALADYTARLYGIAPDPERVTVTSSGMTGIVHVLQAILAPGEKVAVVSPVWPNIMAAVEMAGGQVVQVPLDATPDGGFELDLGRLAAALDEGTRAVFVASPSNPTGWMMEAGQQAELLALCRGRGIWVIADEVYHRFTYDRPHAPSFAQHAEPEDALICVHSFSKAWAMTGWRMGWLLHPPSLGETFGKLIEFTTSGAPAFLQAGCLAAITEGEGFVAELVERCRTGGEVVFQGLSTLPGVTLARPKAAFYSFFKVEGLDDSLDFCFRLLDEQKVGLAPGSAFGQGGEGYLRLCFASSPERLSTAMDRLRHFLAETRQAVDNKA